MFVCVTRFETGLFQEPGIYIYIIYIIYIYIFGRNLRPLWKNHKLITFWFHGEKSSGIKVNIAAQRGRVIDLRGFKNLHEFSASTFDLKHYQRVDSLLKLTSRPPRTRTPRSQYFRETVNTKTRAQINKGSKHKPNYKQSLNLGRMEIAHTLFFLRWQQWARSSRSRHGNHLPNEVQLSTQAKMRHGSPDPLHCNCHAITLEKKKMSHCKTCARPGSVTPNLNRFCLI